jgi:hypothetical protein
LRADIAISFIPLVQRRVGYISSALILQWNSLYITFHWSEIIVFWAIGIYFCWDRKRKKQTESSVGRIKELRERFLLQCYHWVCVHIWLCTHPTVCWGGGHAQ